MTDSKAKKSLSPRRTGMTHGVRAFVYSGRLPSGRAYKRAMKEVSRTRDLLVAKYGGDKIEPDVLMMIDSAAKAMMIQELCTLYIKKVGVLRRDSLNLGNLELHSVLAHSFVSYSNLTRLSLEAAARLAGSHEQAPDVMAYINAYDQAKADSKDQDAKEEEAKVEEIARPGAGATSCEIPGKGETKE